MLQTKFVQNIKTDILCSINFFPKVLTFMRYYVYGFYEFMRMWKNTVQPDRQYHKAHALCMQDK
jgi:hypothetical protein